MNAPTLIVGLGGKGSDIVLRVSKMVSDDQRKSIGFVVFDTDVNELRQIEEENPYVTTIQTSTNLSVGEYLDIDKHARDSWFPVNSILNSKQLTEGAGQVRAISRLAFETAVRAGKLEKLQEAIEDLYKLEGETYQQALRVIIVSSLAGGTGSGLILPVALYIKNYLHTHFRQAGNITRGFFLLPEVFYSVIPGQAERNNLKTNAYATLKELDAFLMKGDNTLEDRYQSSVKIEFPNVTTHEFEEYKERPFDFCFLFDAQNADGKKLNSFDQYLNHAASCIYAQSIGPMNKRSNSSEDNTIRKLVEEKGRNRYAGAGTSMLIYPYNDIHDYIALNWASENVSNQWLVFDNEFKKRQKENARARRNGVHMRDLTPERCYIDTIESKADQKDPFAKQIYNSCMKYDESGVTVVGPKWEDYVQALVKKIKEDTSNGDGDMDEYRRDAFKKISALKGVDNSGNPEDTMQEFKDTYYALQRYKNMVDKFSEESGRTIAYTLYHSQSETATTDGYAFQLETHMRDEKGDFIHPTAMRYFLYKTLEIMYKQQKDTSTELEKEGKFFEGFEKATFDDPKTEDIQEGVEDLGKRNIGFMDKLRHRLSEDQQNLIDQYNKYLKKADEYRTNAVLIEVLNEGISYIKELNTSFQQFFASFDEKINGVNKQISTLERKYDNANGTATRYVCATKTCLSALLEECPYQGGSLSIDNKLAEKIFTMVRNYSLLSNKGNNSDDYFKEIFESGILGYYKQQVNEVYGDIIKMDIISAIEKEAQYTKGYFDQNLIDVYVKHVIDQTKVLAVPFIEKPLGEEKNPINSCTYSNKLDPKDDSPRSALVQSELRDFGGQPDMDIPLNTIIFYKSYYGLRANDLSKFAPPREGMTYATGAGEYYRAYYELVSQIHPEPHKSKVITPHIDRWWHAVSKMPDLDETHQNEMENETYKAFFWAIICKYIDLYNTAYDQAMYRLDAEKLKLEDNRLIVSNGTPCDKLYEVLDALSIYPKLVSHVLSHVSVTIEDERQKNTKYEDSILHKGLEKFNVKEYPIVGNVRSIFDLPLLMKKSVINGSRGDYSERRVVKILKTEIDEIENYLTNFYSEKELPLKAGEIIMNQFNQFLADIKLEEEEWKDIYQDYLFSTTLSIISEALRNLSQFDKADEVENKREELKNK